MPSHARRFLKGAAPPRLDETGKGRAGPHPRRSGGATPGKIRAAGDGVSARRRSRGFWWIKRRPPGCAGDRRPCWQPTEKRLLTSKANARPDGEFQKRDPARPVGDREAAEAGAFLGSEDPCGNAARDGMLLEGAAPPTRTAFDGRYRSGVAQAGRTG
jgi:hypothetical protein